MRTLIAAAAIFLAGAVGSARAGVDIAVDKDTQTLTVAVDGEQVYRWPVSTGNPRHETPNGSFKAFRLAKDHFSKEFDNAPMPNSIFFTSRGHAIHGTFSEGSLGTPVSHGCVRLSRKNAATLFALVRERGLSNTTVTLKGSSEVALAGRTSKPRRRTAARHAVEDEYAVDGVNVGDDRYERRGRYGSVAMDDYDEPPRRIYRDLAPPVYAPPAYVPESYPAARYRYGY